MRGSKNAWMEEKEMQRKHKKESEDKGSHIRLLYKLLL